MYYCFEGCLCAVIKLQLIFQVLHIEKSLYCMISYYIDEYIFYDSNCGLQWCDALEELLQCPVCLDTAQGMKYQCVNGHHICSQCKMQLHICPICKSQFIGTRNLAVEQITAKLQDIKVEFFFFYIF